MINLCLLGCGGSVPQPERSLTSLLLNIKGSRILIDCGEGTQVSMKQVGWGFKNIDIICLTHFHLDHILGLPGLLLTIANSDRRKDIKIIGPVGLSKVIDAFKIFFTYLPFNLNIIECNGTNNSIFETDDFNISTLSLDHSVNCIGYSIDVKRKRKFEVKKAESNGVPKEIWKDLQNGKTKTLDEKVFTSEMVLGEERKGIKISYITDTRPIREIESFVKGSNLFICEGMYGDENDIIKAKENKHMTFSEAANIAKNANVKELWLTHFSPSMEDENLYLNNAKNVFKNTKLGFDRAQREIKYEE